MTNAPDFAGLELDLSTLSQVFPVSTPPTRPGIYLRTCSSFKSATSIGVWRYQYWGGGWWGHFSFKPEYAYRGRLEKSEYQDGFWVGLRNPPPLPTAGAVCRIVNSVSSPDNDGAIVNVIGQATEFDMGRLVLKNGQPGWWVVRQDGEPLMQSTATLNVFTSQWEVSGQDRARVRVVPQDQLEVIQG